jgi:hypothetical protein
MELGDHMIAEKFKEDEGHIRSQKLKSIEKLRAWKNLRQCSRRFRDLADKMYEFESLHFLDAVIKKNVPAVKKLLAQKSIDPATSVGYSTNFALMYACWKDDVELVKLLLNDERVAIPDDKGTNYSVRGVAQSREMSEILSKFPNRVVHKCGKK